MPIWLAMLSQTVPFPSPITVPGLTLYPAFLVPDNLVPPYGVVDINPAGKVYVGGLRWRLVPRGDR